MTQRLTVQHLDVWSVTNLVIAEKKYAAFMITNARPLKKNVHVHQTINVLGKECAAKDNAKTLHKIANVI